MRLFLRPLMIGIGLLTAAGCALPGGGIGRTSNASSESQRFADSFDKPSANNRLSFKPPSKMYQAEVISPATASKNPPSQSRSSPQESHDLQAGHSFDSNYGSSSVEQASGRTARNSANTQQGELELASASRQDLDSPNNYIKLQNIESSDSGKTQIDPGLEQFSGFWNGNDDDDPSAAGNSRTNANGNIQNWSDRPKVRKPDRLRKTSKRDSNTPQAHREPRPAQPIPDPLPPLPWQDDLERLIARVEQDLTKSRSDRTAVTPSEYLRRQAQLRLLYLMSQRQEEALTAIAGVSPSEQEYWQQILLALSSSFDTNQFPDSGDRAAQILVPLSTAIQQVRENAPLSIKNMGFCRKISYFGNYERFPRNEFTPGQEILLYTEIENFVSNPTPEGEYRTSLKSLIEIVDFDGKVVWEKRFPPTEDFCRNPRRDYFHNYQFHIPKELSTGTYSLKLTIEDELSHKRISNSLNFVLK